MDIQMPEINGFDVLSNIRLEPLPLVIFVTAYDQYALKAFEIHAIDYLLKPFTDERFYQALRFAKDQLSNTSDVGINGKLSSLLGKYISDQNADSDRLINEGMGSQRMVIKSSGKIIFLKLEDIHWVEAFDYYIKIHIDEKFYLVRESMKHMELRLPSDRFIRIHKSSIVNLEKIQEMEHLNNSEYLIKLQNGTQLKVSRSYRKNLDFILN
jgi:two-component system LytT family response regulator